MQFQKAYKTQISRYLSVYFVRSEIPYVPTIFVTLQIRKKPWFNAKLLSNVRKMLQNVKNTE